MPKRPLSPPETGRSSERSRRPHCLSMAPRRARSVPRPVYLSGTGSRHPPDRAARRIAAMLGAVEEAVAHRGRRGAGARRARRGNPGCLSAAPGAQHQGLARRSSSRRHDAAEEAGASAEAAGSRLAALGLRPAPHARARGDQAAAAVPHDLDVQCAPAARVPARDRLRAPLHQLVRRRLLRPEREDGQGAVALQLEPLRRLLGRRRPRRRLRDVHRPAALQQAEPGRPRARGGVQRAHRQAPLALPGRPRRDLAPARQRARLRRELGRRRVGDRPEDGRPALALQDRRPGQGLRRALRLERDRRAPTTATSTPSTRGGASRSGAGRPSRASACRSGPSTRPPRSPTAASTSATRTARSTRTARRRASSAGRTRPAATSTPRPRVWHERVYAGSYDGTFYALDAATGDTVWTFKAAGPISGAPTIINGVVYFACFKNRTYALDAKHREAPLELRGRALHSGRRRRKAPLPRRLRPALRDDREGEKGPGEEAVPTLEGCRTTSPSKP